MTPPMTPAIRLTTTGFVATAVAFGPARMGFGLFLPAFRADFALSTSLAGLIASGGFLAFLAALLASAWICHRYGERMAVIIGALAATVGFAAVAIAATPVHLALGIALAGASAGLCWAPFNDAVERVVPDSMRDTALSVISTGTAFGVVAAAGLALAVTAGALDWRGAWIAFMLSGLVLTAMTLPGLPRRRDAAAPDRAAGLAPRLTQPAAFPLYSTAMCFGMANAVFLSFAADRVVAAGGLPGLPDDAAAAVIFLAYGICGMLGLTTGRIEARTGLAPLFCAIFGAAALSLALIALAPASWSAVLAASGLHGMALMMVSAVFSFWSLRLFPNRGTLGFTAALVSLAAGSVLGPALAGLLATALGPQVMFLTAAAPPLITAVWFGMKLRRARPRLPPMPV